MVDQAHMNIHHDGVNGSNEEKKAEKLNIFQTALALVATNVGAGILGMPYAFYHFGIINSIFACLIISVLTHVSVMLYLRTKDLTPRKYESVYEIAYLLNGRGGLFTVILTQMLANFSSLILYYMILGDTLGHLFA